MEKIFQGLSKDLIAYLITRGYTHLHILGVTDEKPDLNNEHKNDFVLVPL